MALLNFDATSVAPATAYEAIPSGDYLGMIVESDMKPTKAGTGSYLQLTLRIIDGEHNGRKLFDRLNLDNPNQTAVEIAQRTLSAICHSTGVMAPTDSAELHDKTMLIKVGVEQDKLDGTLRNVVKGYSSANQGTAAFHRPATAPQAQTPAPQAPFAAQPAPAAPGKAAPPWGR